MGAVVKMQTGSEQETMAQLWLDAFCQHGDATRAVLEAGYHCTTQASASAMGSRNKVRYQNQILQRTRQIIASNAPAAVNSLILIAASGESESSRAVACRALLQMAGMDEPDTSAQAVDSRTDEQLAESIANLINENKDIKRMILSKVT